MNSTTDGIKEDIFREGKWKRKGRKVKRGKLTEGKEGQGKTKGWERKAGRGTIVEEKGNEKGKEWEEHSK